MSAKDAPEVGIAAQLRLYHAPCALLGGTIQATNLPAYRVRGESMQSLKELSQKMNAGNVLREGTAMPLETTMNQSALLALSAEPRAQQRLTVSPTASNVRMVTLLRMKVARVVSCVLFTHGPRARAVRSDAPSVPEEQQ